MHLFAAIRHIWLLGEHAGRADWGSAAVSAHWLENMVKDLLAWEEDKLIKGLF